MKIRCWLQGGFMSQNILTFYGQRDLIACIWAECFTINIFYWLKDFSAAYISQRIFNLRRNIFPFTKNSWYLLCTAKQQWWSFMALIISVSYSLENFPLFLHLDIWVGQVPAYLWVGRRSMELACFRTFCMWEKPQLEVSSVTGPVTRTLT